MTLTVREMTAEETDLIVDYFHASLNPPLYPETSSKAASDEPPHA